MLACHLEEERACQRHGANRVTGHFSGEKERCPSAVRGPDQSTGETQRGINGGQACDVDGLRLGPIEPYLRLTDRGCASNLQEASARDDIGDQGRIRAHAQGSIIMPARTVYVARLLRPRSGGDGQSRALQSRRAAVLREGDDAVGECAVDARERAERCMSGLERSPLRSALSEDASGHRMTTGFQRGRGELSVEHVRVGFVSEGDGAVDTACRERRARRPGGRDARQRFFVVRDERRERVERATVVAEPDEAHAPSNARARALFPVGRRMTFPLAEALETVFARPGESGGCAAHQQRIIRPPASWIPRDHRIGLCGRLAPGGDRRGVPPLARRRFRPPYEPACVVEPIVVRAGACADHEKKPECWPHRPAEPSRRSYASRYAKVAAAMESAISRWRAGVARYRASATLVPKPISTRTAGMKAVVSTTKPACFTPREGPGCTRPSPA